MGNKMCKKKADCVDGPKTTTTPFDRIITRLHLRPSKWKSDSHLEDKQVNRYQIQPKDMKNGNLQNKQIRPLSNAKSSDWTEVSLVVPDQDETDQQFKNSKLVLTENYTSSTPIPPPRKHKKGIREKIESVAKTGLQAFQSKKPVEEPLCIKKTINYVCPCGDPTHKINHRHHKQDRKAASVSKATAKQLEKEGKRKKNLSVISLPNYNELKLSIAKVDDDIERRSSNNSAISLPGEAKKLTPTPKKDYMTRCRSFGSILPNQLLEKLKTPKSPADVESDDSFGALEDWDLRILEHYNPKDSSLPRVRKPVKPENEVLSELEGLIVTEEEIKPPPKPPVRRGESLLKKITRTAAEHANKRRTPEVKEKLEVPKSIERPNSVTPPPSPEIRTKTEINVQITKNKNLPETDEKGHVEHSSLMKILQKYSTEEKQKGVITEEDSIPYIDDNGKFETETISDMKTNPNKVETKIVSSNFSSISMTPSVMEYRKVITNPVEEFLNAERAWNIKQQISHDMIKT